MVGWAWDLRGWFRRLLVGWVGGNVDALWQTGWRDRRATWLWLENGQASQFENFQIGPSPSNQIESEWLIRIESNLEALQVPKRYRWTDDITAHSKTLTYPFNDTIPEFNMNWEAECGHLNLECSGLKKTRVFPAPVGFIGFNWV